MRDKQGRESVYLNKTRIINRQEIRTKCHGKTAMEWTSIKGCKDINPSQIYLMASWWIGLFARCGINIITVQSDFAFIRSSIDKNVSKIHH